MAAVAEYDMDAIYRICGPEPRSNAPQSYPDNEVLL